MSISAAIAFLGACVFVSAAGIMLALFMAASAIRRALLARHI